MHSLHLATPKGYSLFDKPRLTGRHGGTAVIANSVLASSVLSLPAFSSFEHLAIKLPSPMSFTLAVIYRPPKSNSAFIAEFSEFLSLICTSTDKILLLGDFNIHVDLSSSRLVTDFNMLLDCLGLSESVNVPTYTRGHTLDLLFTRDLDISNLSISDISVSETLGMCLCIPSNWYSPVLN
ncbi:UNVERIFIED_CONTAM: hypothetical protein FKN15_023148 [Acipenser sinensis]